MPNPSFSVKDFFASTWKNFLEIVTESAAASASQMPAVKEKIEEAKTVEAKNILWKFFPYVAIPTVIFLVIKFFK
ncbi:hypothetical protein ES703_16571 [subsurface metagenome]